MPDDLSPEFVDAGSALDKHFAHLTGTPPPAPEEVVPPATPDPAPAKTPDPAPAKAPDPAPAPAPAPAKAPDPSPLPEELASLAGTPPAAPDPAPPAAPAKNDAIDKIEAVQLSPHAQPRTAESFATVKTLAKEEIGRQAREISELRAQLEAASAAPKADPLSEADKKELADLRAFRSGIQLRGDPAFVARFEKPLTDLESDFYRRLEEAGATPENIEAIKKLGGIDKIDVGALLEKVGSVERRGLEAILRRRDDLKLDRDSATAKSEAELRKTADEYRKEREASAGKETEQVLKGFGDLVPQVPDLQKYEVPAGADEATRKQIQSANQQIEKILTDAQAMARQNDPTTRAQLGVLAALSVVHRLRSQGLRTALSSTRAQLDAAKEAHAKEVKALNDQLATYKGASRIGGPRDPLKSSTPAPAPEEARFNTTAESAFAAFERERAARNS